MKKYKISIIISIILVIIGLTITLLFNNKNNNNSLKTLSNSSFSFKYDNSWKLKSNKNNKTILEHKRAKSTLSIEIIELEEEYKYQNIKDIKDDFMYEIESQNKDYNLIAQENIEITKNNYEGYKILYENKEEQSLVIIGKISNQLIIFNYNSSFVYFDLVLDSVNNIIYNFEIKEEDYKLTYKIDYKTSNTYFENNELLDKNLKNTNTYEIGMNNYIVKYSIPNIFKLNEINSTHNFFSYEEDNYRITLTANIYKKNIYEYIDKKSESMMYREYELIKKNKEYSNQKEELIDLNNNNYSYQIFYTSKGKKYGKDFKSTEYDKTTEITYLLFTLDKNHVFEIKIESTDIEISKKFIEMIKILSSKNISSNFDRNIEDDKLIGELKRYTDYNKNKVEVVKILLPTNYYEIDKETNLYETRNYTLNYNEDTSIYDYEISYSLIDGYKIDKSIENINATYNSYASYGSIKPLENIDNLKLNEKDFTVYKGQYYNRTGGLLRTDEDIIYKIDTRVLYYTVSNDSYIKIEIEGNDKEITKEILNEITNFEINYSNI